MGRRRARDGRPPGHRRPAPARAPAPDHPRHADVPPQDQRIHDPGGDQVRARGPAAAAGRPDGPAGLDVPQALPGQARVPRRPGGVRLLRAVGRVGGGPALEAPRTAPAPGEGRRHDGAARGRGRGAVRPAPSPLQARGGGGRRPSPRPPRRASSRCDGRRVLDLGCGKGRFATRLAESGAEVVGIDLSAAMLAEAKGLARVRGSARRLPFASATFDAVVAVEVFEHLADDRRGPPRGCAGCSGPAGSWRSSTRTPAR